MSSRADSFYDDDFDDDDPTVRNGNGGNGISSSSSDEEIVKAMSGNDDAESESLQNQQKKTIRLKKRQTKKSARSRQTVTNGVHGERVVARCDLDGYYYPGRVTAASVVAGKVVVDFDDAPLKRCDVFSKHVITFAGAISRPFIRLRDTVLVLVRNGLTSLYAYIPGIVTVTPVSDSQQAKCYSILAYNRRSVTAFRYQIIRIAEKKFNATVNYITERAALMGIKPLAPISRKKLLIHNNDHPPTTSRSTKSRVQSASLASSRLISSRQQPRRLSPIPTVQTTLEESLTLTVDKTGGSGNFLTTPASNNDRQHSSSSSRRSSIVAADGPSSPVVGELAVVSVEADAVGADVLAEACQTDVSTFQLIDRALSPINLVAPTEVSGEEETTTTQPTVVEQTTENKQQAAEQECEESSSSEDSSDGEIVRPERRKRVFVKAAPLDGTFRVGQTVLARSSDDGWFYRWKVAADLGNGAYSLRSKTDPSDQEHVWKEHMLPMPSSKDDPKLEKDQSDGESSDEEDESVIRDTDCVIAKRSDFQSTYCPASVELVNQSTGGDLMVRFCDDLVAPVHQKNCAKISQKTYNEAVLFIKHCQDRWLGEKVVVLNPSSQEGGFQPLAGSYVVGVVRHRDRESDRRYLVELAQEIVRDPTLRGDNDDDSDDDSDHPIVIKQSVDHIFGRFTKSRKLRINDAVLAPVDAHQRSKKYGYGIYLPGTVRSVRKNNKNLTVKLVNGVIVDGLSARDVFWLTNDYFEAAEQFFRQTKQLPIDAAEPSKVFENTEKVKSFEVAPALDKASKKQAAPKIVVEDFDRGGGFSKKATSPATSEERRKEVVPTPPTMPKPTKKLHKLEESQINRCEEVLQSEGGTHVVMGWILDGSVLATQRLGDVAGSYDRNLANAIYFRAGFEQKALEGVNSPDSGKNLVSAVMKFDPEIAVEVAKRLVQQKNLMDQEEMSEVFENSPKFRLKFMLETIDDDDSANGPTETELLELSASIGREELNRVLSSGKLTKYNRSKAVMLCKKADLYERWVEQLKFVDDIKIVLGEHAHEMDLNWVTQFFENLTPDDMFDCIEEMMLSNRSGEKNLPVVLHMIKRFHRTLDVNNIVDLLERLQMTNELFVVLQAVLKTSRNPIMITKFMQVACLVDHVAEAEQICRDPSAVFMSETVWEFLVNAKMPKTGRLMALMCDRFGLVVPFVKFCHENNQYRLLEAFVSRISPSRLHEVVEAMEKIGASRNAIDRVISAVSPSVSADTSPAATSPAGYIE